MNNFLSVLIFILLFCHCKENSPVVAKGDEVFLHFKITNHNGMRIDDSNLPCGKLPLRIIAGQAYVFEGFDETLLGMKEGESKSSRILPEKAYGNRALFYLDSTKLNKYVINANDTLTLYIEIEKINKMN